MAEIVPSIEFTGSPFISRKRSPLLKPNRDAIRPGSRIIKPFDENDNQNFDWNSGVNSEICKSLKINSEPRITSLTYMPGISTKSIFAESIVPLDK